MRRELTVSGAAHLRVDPQTAYDAVSDVVQMGRWSPENTGARLVGPDDRTRAGTRFVGSNRRGRARWQTRCTVVTADPGRAFAFDVDRWGLGPLLVPVAVASWHYTFEPDGDGTLVTETWHDRRTRWPDLVTRVFDRAVTGHPSFAAFQRGNISRTLRRLKRELEAEAAYSGA